MRRAIARGRMFPQSYSTDRRYGRLSLKAIGLFPLMWANADDQGRLCGDPEEIKYAVCPNIDHITKQDIPGLLQELQDNKLILCYDAPKSAAIQLLDWWEANQKMQWAWPSQYPPSEGWQDHLRYKRGAKEVVTQGWPVSGENPGENPGESSGENLGAEIRSILIDLPESIDRLAEHEAVKEALAQIGRSKGFIPRSEVKTTTGRRVDLTWELRGQVIAAFEIDPFLPRKRSLTKLKNLDCKYRFVILRSNEEPLQWLEGILLIGLAKERESTKEREDQNERETIKRRGRGRGNSPEPSGENPTPSSAAYLKFYIESFEKAWGRKPNTREAAQLRDLEKKISAAGGATAEQIYDAFKEAAMQNKLSISYVRAILLDWLGIERSRSP